MMCNAVVEGEQAPDQDGSGLGSDNLPPPGQDSLERDLGGDSWDQGSGNEGQNLQLLALATHASHCSHHLTDMSRSMTVGLGTVRFHATMM